MPYRTYQTYSQADLGLSDADWDGLVAYVESINSALAEAQSDRPRVEEIEVPPPSISDDGFSPGGWAGQYPPDVTVKPGRLDDEEFESLLADIQGWAEVVGADTISASLPLSNELLLDERTRLAGYSRALIEYTETILAHRLPVTVTRTREREQSPQGRPVMSDTITQRAQGRRDIVTENVEFSFETLPNYLLVRFHIELANQMRALADEFTYYERAFQRQIRYHEQFIQEGIPGQLVDDALETDFGDPRILSKVRRAVSGEMAEVVDLWEAFQRAISMEIELASNLTSAIKPMSKIYELWCLSLLDRLLTDIVGTDGTRPESLSGVFEYGSSVKLYYNRSIATHSNFLWPGMGISPGAPDFALEADGELVWVGDAKYKTWRTLDLDDYRRFITYLVDLVPEAETGTILYIDDSSGSFRREQDFQAFSIEHIAARPRTKSQSSGFLREKFERLL
ncbi:hypothetical protein [Haloglomus litoreum]|uniref:hypothetical protein n=1 Tax=Haloglomus litoreum TaxID=3034026 RepID=UPI0023E75856|nr:hypothetical protein [Haloglomus sp. DT116]